jgi:hypothetical protein
MNKEKQITPYPLRLEPDLRKHLEEVAAQNGRSLHAEIVACLSAASGHKSDTEKADEERIRAIALDVVREELSKAGKQT